MYYLHVTYWCNILYNSPYIMISTVIQDKMEEENNVRIHIGMQKRAHQSFLLVYFIKLIF